MLQKSLIGGISTNYLNDFFYLDVSTSFNTQNLPWVDLSSTNTIVPQHASATSVKGVANNNTLILYGGFANQMMSSLYTFDTQSNTWSSKITGNIPRKGALSGIMEHNGKMYLWGGSADRIKSLNDMFILDTINLFGGIVNLVDAPKSRFNYGATLIPNNNIIYMGGFNSEIWAELPLDQTTTGSSRDGFSAILGLDNQSVIIFGGTATFSTQNLALEDPLYELNLLNFEWHIPKISSTSQIPKGRMYHKANVIGKYMVISFGEGYDVLTESDILLLDISNKVEYAWTNNFDLSSSTTSKVPSVKPTTTQQPSDALSKNKLLIIVAAILGSLIGCILLIVRCFFLYKWNKNKQIQRNIIPTPGERDYNQGSIENVQTILRIPSIPITNNKRFSSQDLNNIKNELKQEIMQNLRQEMLQNNEQSSNITRNSNSYCSNY
ncbi:hypothetical protein C1645_865206 [Glomus cerebriforme]|uniref:Galactose oxidase n=1 Tax=Glomus cerebriforme TaxID=658196 RepID=A0A397SB46_9GLOM|nr:hypothetical protein C1645_865206 [Glomus cerebriforme]